MPDVLTPTWFRVGFTIPDMARWHLLPAGERKTLRDGLLNGGNRGFDTGGAPDVLPWLRGMSVNDVTRHLTETQITDEINDRLELLTGGTTYKSGGPTSDGVIYVLHNGVRVCIHTYALEDGSGPVSETVTPSSGGDITVDYTVSLYWS